VHAQLTAPAAGWLGFRELDAGWYTGRPGLGLYHRYFGGVAYA
jgi:hypothetical protein